MKRIINTRTILILAIALSSIAVLRQNIRTQLLLSGITLILVLLQEGRKELFRKIFGRLKHLWYAIMTIVILQVIFRREGDPLISFYFLKVTDTGILYGLSVGMRLINLILVAGLLFNISSSAYMLAFKAWKVPFEISFLITTVIRFIPDYYKLFIAYRETMYLRNITLRKLSIKSKLTALISLLIPALTTNLAEVKFRAIALDLKGFRYAPHRTCLHESRLKFIDYLIQIFTLIGFIYLMFFN